jgi:hypothetical protein
MNVTNYSEKHAAFRVNKAGGTRGEGVTQFARALHDLNIESICASPTRRRPALASRLLLSPMVLVSVA